MSTIPLVGAGVVIIVDEKFLIWSAGVGVRALDTVWVKKKDTFQSTKT